LSKHYGDIAFTGQVRDAQILYNGGRALAGIDLTESTQQTGDPLTSRERSFLAEQDGFYIASVSESGWPYVQYRGGPPGCLRVIDKHTVGWADFQGNRQYITAGNLAGDNRVALIVLDYAVQSRLKIFGRARVAVQ
jgi:predicted pyridoxine 5'-phosphate oxidase superfamily flavin-nucleotide-binding protein